MPVDSAPIKTILDSLSGRPPDIRAPRDPIGITVLYAFTIPGAIFGAASFVALREASSKVVRGRIWPILASLLSACAGLITLWALVASGRIFLHEKWPWTLVPTLYVPLGAGVVGLFVFSCRGK